MLMRHNKAKQLLQPLLLEEPSRRSSRNELACNQAAPLLLQPAHDCYNDVANCNGAA
jgi:hypothetical protein